MIRKVRSGAAFIAGGGLILFAVYLLQLAVRTQAGGYPTQLLNDSNAGVVQTNAYIDIAGDFAWLGIASGIAFGLAIGSLLLGAGLILRNVLPAQSRLISFAHGTARPLVAGALFAGVVLTSTFSFGVYNTSDPTLRMNGYSGPLANSATIANKDALMTFVEARVFYATLLGLAISLTVLAVVALLASRHGQVKAASCAVPLLP